jgi:hypothetical protein
MNNASRRIVREICDELQFPSIGMTLTQEEADAVKQYVQTRFFDENIQGAVHSGLIRKEELEPHQERVVEEKQQLDEKIAKLAAFIGGTMFASLDDAERSRLSIQLQHMNGYSEILGQRIAAF